MKRTQVSARLFPILLAFVMLLGTIPAFAAEPGSTLRYRHDPRLNAKAMADVVVDPSAVYGFSPSPDGSLAAYAKYDWTDPAAVESYKQNRIDFLASYRQMYDMLDEMTAAGKSTEEIARAVSAKRNELRLAAYDGDPDGLATVKERNLARYGHEEGPLADELYAQYGSWNTVLEKAFSHNPGMDACVGLYDDYYNDYLAFGYVTDERTTPATREYAIAVLAEAAGLDGAGTLDGFTDADSVGAAYASSVRKAAAAGVIKGCGDGTLRPQSAITRAEALVLLSRCLPELETVREAASYRDVPAWAKADAERLSAAALLAAGDGVLGAADTLTVDQVELLAARAEGGSLMRAIAAANGSQRVLHRYETVLFRQIDYLGDEVRGTFDAVIGADSVFVTCKDGTLRYYDRAHALLYDPVTGSTDAVELTPAEYAAELEYEQLLFEYSELEKLDSVREQDGVLLVTTRTEDADYVRGFLDAVRSEYGDGIDVPSGVGVTLICNYRLDPESMEIRGGSTELLLSDGSRILVDELLLSFGADAPAQHDPTAADSPFRSFFDGAAQG